MALAPDGESRSYELVVRATRGVSRAVATGLLYGGALPDNETIRQNVRDAFGRFMTAGEYELAERLYHPDYVNHEADPERSAGPAGARATAEWLRSCFGNLSYEVERIIVEDDMAAAYVTMRGTHEGGLPPGMPATHKPFAVKHVHLIRFADDGRALEHWAVRDDLGLAMQAGLLPAGPPDSAPQST